MGITTTGWPGKRSKNAATCSGFVALSSDSIGRLWRTGACSTAGAPTRSSGFGSGVKLGMLGQQRPQLVLERVVVGVGHERLAAVVRVAQLGEPRGQLLDARSGVGARAHPLKHLATVRQPALWA